jgi:receptor expression-enhancing protein 5/6
MSNSSAITLANLQQRFRKALDEKNFFTNILSTLEEKTKVKKELIAYGIIGFLAFYLIVGWGNDFVCNLIGFAYPAYASIRAIESAAKEDDTKWLMYWCAYALFGILEFFSDLLLFWIPLYTLTKCLFLIWLMVPGKNGGTNVIYYKILRPFVLKHQGKIEQLKDDAIKTINEMKNQ